MKRTMRISLVILVAFGAIPEVPQSSPAPSPFPGSLDPLPIFWNPAPFIPAAAVLYGPIGNQRPGSCYPIEEAARFSLLDLSMYLATRTSRWCGAPNRPLLAIRNLNPASMILLYRMGPKELNWLGSRGPVSGQEYFERLRQSHGVGSDDRWFAIGERSGDYLVDLSYPQYVAMEPGNPNWQDYWIEQGWLDMWGPNPIVNAEGASGVFIDGAETSAYSHWSFCPMSSWDQTERRCSAPADYPTTYRANGSWNDSLYVQHLFQFIRKAVPWYRSRGLILMFNAWKLRPDYIAVLNETGGHAMEECGFVCGTFPPRPNHWRERLDTLRSAAQFAVLSTNRIYPSSGSGLGKMDQEIWNGMRGWDVLWFAMTSFLLGYDPQRRNGYFHFTAWEYRDSYWFDEYDPRLFNLGLPKAPAQELPSGVWMREFQWGWVWVNPTDRPQMVVAPRGRVRVLNHDNFKQANSVPAVASFILPPWTGVAGVPEAYPIYLPLVAR